jgi:hypothetical protein
MKNGGAMKNRKISTYGLALTVAAIGMAGCGGGGSSSAPVYLPAKQTIESYPVSGILKGSDGFALSGTVSLAAADAAGKSVRLYSDKTDGTVVTSISVADDGLISFFVDRSAVLPVTIKAVGTTSTPNHISGSSRFAVTKSGTTFFTVTIVDMNNPSAGVNPVIAENGVLGKTDSLLKVPVAMAVTATQVTIPSGTSLLNGTNSPLGLDSVTGVQLLDRKIVASLTTFASSSSSTPIIDPAVFSYDPQAENAPDFILNPSDLENFPGGMNSAVTADGNSGYFLTAGFVSVEVTDASGTQAKKIDNGGGFIMRINIPDGIVDPNTDLPVKEGDSIPIYTYDEKIMTWIPETTNGGVGTVKSDPVTGGLYVIHTTNHFSTWNLGWPITKPGSTCTGTIKLMNDAIALPLNLKATITPTKNSSGNTKVKNMLLTGFKPAGDNTITVVNTPNQHLDIVLTDTANKVIFSKSNYDLCKAPLTASYIAPVSKKAVPITLKVTEACRQNPDVSQVVPGTLTTASAYVNHKYTPVSYGMTNTNGVYVHNLVPGGPYVFSAFDRRTSKYVQAPNKVNVDKGHPQTVSIVIPVDCVPVSGSTGSSGLSLQ